MISYKALTGVEIQHWEGMIYFWMSWGVYSLQANTLHRHGKYTGNREVNFWLLDLCNGNTTMYTTRFDDSFDDWEIINRYISGTGACDCVRGHMMYGQDARYPCNRNKMTGSITDNRFIIQKMVIKGEPTSSGGAKLNCVVSYKGYM